MFLRWLFTTFPHEMRTAWTLLRPDVVLWLALSALVAVAALAMPPPSDTPPPALPLFVTVATGLVTTMLPPVLFTAQIEGRQLTWGPVLLLMARKAAPLVAYAMTAVFVAWSAQAIMGQAIELAFGDSPAVPSIRTVAETIILISILVRFSFLPFVVILNEREKLPASLWKWRGKTAPATAGEEKPPQRWVEVVANVFWPLIAASRLSEGRRWRLVFYTLLGQLLPFLATFAPAALMLPAAIAALMILTMVQGVFFQHYRASCEAAGVAAPTLPLEAALIA